MINDIKPDFVLKNRVSIILATECFCGEQLPDFHRKTVINKVITNMKRWYGGATKMEGNGIEGFWNHDDGTPSDENITIVFSHASDKKLNKHEDDLKKLTQSVANSLTQAETPCIINDQLDLYQGHFNECIHNKIPQELEGLVPKPISKKILSKKESIKNILNTLSGEEDIKYLFYTLLGYQSSIEFVEISEYPEKLKNIINDQSINRLTSFQGFEVLLLNFSNDKLLKSEERLIVEYYLGNDKSKNTLFIISNKKKDIWHFIQPVFNENSRKWVLRRIIIQRSKTTKSSVEKISELEFKNIKNLDRDKIKFFIEKIFDVEEVAQDFYRKVSNWFFWALNHQNVVLPNDVKKESEKPVFFIRLLTRLMFCWFLKENKLIPDQLFDQNTISKLLKSESADKGTYYKAILQNLFFATLNQEIELREFQNTDDRSQNNVYKYKSLISEIDEFEGLVNRIPFVNGGLFDCLDELNGNKSKYLDGFSENIENKLCIPNELFWGQEIEIDLSSVYGHKKYEKEKVSGLLNVLKLYQFTVDEDTSFDQSVALDPELLGKVFENLLAAYNDETKKTARKDHGAFYTPRLIVDYMVEESLISYLSTYLKHHHCQSDGLENNIKKLFSDGLNVEKTFNKDQIESILSAIKDLKVIDPSVGSGAFPMGLLQKLLKVLNTIDPKDLYWKEHQINQLNSAIQGLEKIPDPITRNSLLKEFENQKLKVIDDKEENLNYRRKLYLIENCIYGVDIQPIAAQISRMRFFISLIVEQKIDFNKKNLGITPLPNLETHIVVANSLINLEEKNQLTLPHAEIQKKENELKSVRSKYFSTNNFENKLKLKEEDKLLRNEISKLLISDGWETDKASFVSEWNPYDQNSAAGFFDPEWMFGINEGFDIVIGNPPYGATFDQNMKNYIRKNFDSYEYKYESYVYFMEKSLDLANSKGFVTLITPHLWLRLEKNYLIRKKYFHSSSIKFIHIFGENVFNNVVVNSAISHFQKDEFIDEFKIIYSDNKWKYSRDEWEKETDLIIDYKITPDLKPVISKLEHNSKILSNLGELVQGITAYDKEKGHSEETIKNQTYHSDHKDDDDFQMWLNGNDISRYNYEWNGKWLKYGPWLARPRLDKKHLFSGPRILFREVPGKSKRIQACFVENDTYFHGHSVTPFKLIDSIKVNILFILGIVNSKLLSFYANHKLSNFGKDIFPKLNPQDIKSLPIVNIDISKKEDLLIHDQMCSLVKKIIKAYNVDPLKPSEKLESDLDDLVYKLYGINDDEKEMIEKFYINLNQNQ